MAFSVGTILAWSVSPPDGLMAATHDNPKSSHAALVINTFGDVSDGPGPIAIGDTDGSADSWCATMSAISETDSAVFLVHHVHGIIRPSVPKAGCALPCLTIHGYCNRCHNFVFHRVRLLLGIGTRCAHRRLMLSPTGMLNRLAITSKKPKLRAHGPGDRDVTMLHCVENR